MATSSANPDRLASYSTGGLELVGTLRSKSGTVTETLGALRSSGSPHVPSLGDADATLRDLADDWLHLDEFVGDVAQGFRQAGAGRTPDGSGAITVDDGALIAAGQVGYADRDEAIAAANAVADELDRLLAENGDATIEEVLAFAAMAERGQFDPAFSVTFSERVGVDGYADATAMIRMAYVLDPDAETVGPQGIAAVGVLAQTMTTALDTLPLYGTGEHRDPDNEQLSDDDRLSPEFLQELISGYEVGYPGFTMPSRMRGPEDYPGTNAIDLSVLLGMTDPPTGVAAAIGDRYLTPVVASQYGDHILTEASAPWGEHGGIVHNYAEMLGRNEDASSMWLASTEGLDMHGEPVGVNNIELVLQRHGDLDIDGGAALAEVVENGLTNEEWADTRESLMHDAIDVIGEQEGIRNEHLYDALASGVEANMSVVDDHINDGWDGRDRGQAPPQGAQNAYEFFEQLMRDDEATERVNTAVNEYALEQLTLLPDDGDYRTNRIEDLGAIKGITTLADVNAVIASEEQEMSDDLARRAMPGNVANWIAGRVPVFGDINDTAGLAGHSVGDFTNGVANIAFPADYGELDAAQQAAIAAEVAADLDMQLLLAMSEEPGRYDLPISDMTEAEHRAALEWAFSDERYDDDDHNAFYAGAQRSTRSFSWEWDSRTNGN